MMNSDLGSNVGVNVYIYTEDTRPLTIIPGMSDDVDATHELTIAVDTGDDIYVTGIVRSIIADAVEAGRKAYLSINKMYLDHLTNQQGILNVVKREDGNYGIDIVESHNCPGTSVSEIVYENLDELLDLYGVTQCANGIDNQARGQFTS